jgi:hypothetical protein
MISAPAAATIQEITEMLPIPARVAGRRNIPDPTIVVATSNIPVSGPIVPPLSGAVSMIPPEKS